MKASETIYSNLNELFDGMVFPLIRPETINGTPYLIYTLLNTNPTNVVAGYTGRELAYVQIDIYTYDYDSCEYLTSQVLDILNREVQPFYYDNRKYSHENDTQLFRQSVECHIWQTV